jgi:hypothetical protein
MLVHSILVEDGQDVVIHDSHVFNASTLPREPRVWLVGCKHPEFVDLKFPKHSVVIDPFRYIPDQDGVVVVRLGWAPAHIDTSASTTPRLAA